MAAKLRKGDEVIVLAGKDKGKKGTVTLVVPKTGKAIVDGVNMAIRHERQTQTTQGGRLPKAMPIDISNLSLLDKNGKATRVDTLRDENFRSEKLRHKQVFDYNETYLADKQSGVRRKHHALKEKDSNGEPKKAKKTSP